jgi:hypothetical protein
MMDDNIMPDRNNSHVMLSKAKGSGLTTAGSLAFKSAASLMIGADGVPKVFPGFGPAGAEYRASLWWR